MEISIIFKFLAFSLLSIALNYSYNNLFESQLFVHGHLSDDKVLFVFDFDRSMVDDDTDEQMARFDNDIQHYFEENLQQINSFELRNNILKMLYEKNVTRAEMEQWLHNVPMSEKVIKAIKHIKEHGYPIFIISDATDFYIDAVLKHYNLLSYVKEIITNHVEFLPTGQMVVEPFVDIHQPHQCNSCPVHLCKGLVMRNIVTMYDKVIYIGDGHNDICGVKQLRESDMVLSRTNHPLNDYLESNKVSVPHKSWEKHEYLGELLFNELDILFRGNYQL